MRRPTGFATVLVVCSLGACGGLVERFPDSGVEAGTVDTSADAGERHVGSDADQAVAIQDATLPEVVQSSPDSSGTPDGALAIDAAQTDGLPPDAPPDDGGFPKCTSDLSSVPCNDPNVTFKPCPKALDGHSCLYWSDAHNTINQLCSGGSWGPVVGWEAEDYSVLCNDGLRCISFACVWPNFAAYCACGPSGVYECCHW